MRDNSNSVTGQGVRPAVSTSKIRVGSVNVGTMKSRGSEIVEMLTRRKIDICCVQETRWRGGSARKIQGKDSFYKFFWAGDQSGQGGVGLLIAENLIDSVLSVERYNNRCIQMRLLIGTVILNIISCYAPQTGLSVEIKDSFYEDLVRIVASVPFEEMLIVGGDLNGHVGQVSAGFEGIHGGHGYGERNPDGIRILDFCVSNNLVITNTFFEKRENQTITYSSGGNKSQIDYILTRRSQFKNVQNTKVIGSEECITQHKLLVSDVVLDTKLN